MISFGDKIKKLRKDRGWSQDDLAEKAGIHGRHVGKYEIGKAMPNAETVVRIAEALEVSIDYLLRDDANENPNPAARIKDRQLLAEFEVVDNMDEVDKSVIKSLIDAYIKKRQMEKMFTGQSGEKAPEPKKAS
jgi:transcriptional regulator with XRE-family HTH domain